MNHSLLRRALAAALCLGAAAGAWGDEALKACRIAGIKNEVQCGSVSRPLDPARPQGVQIAVRYVVVPALARRKLPDPVLLLAGGPGQSAIGVAPQLMPLLTRLNNRRDLVFVDQRGTGRSAPLACDDPRHRPLAEQADPERQFSLILACRDALRRLPHGDLRFYTTTIAMQDLDAVRRQLGAGHVNLVGVSYGTRAALEYLRQFPQHTRRVVVDGVAPPDMALPTSASRDNQAAFDALLAACAGEPACAKAHPTLRANWTALLAGLPRPVSAAHPLSGAMEHFTLTREMVLGAVRGPLYVPAYAAALPQAIDEAAHGRFEPLLGMSSLVGARRGASLAMGMHFSVVCAEDDPHRATSSEPPGPDFGRDFERLYERVCADWPRGEVPAAFYRVPPSPAPILALSGGDDPATPPRHAERVVQALGPKALHVVVAHAGHGVMGIPCMRDVVFRFIDADDDAAALAVDAGCTKGIPRPPAFQPLLPTAEAAR
jgi:pimeloyl-ACP methyl ester carboxylesterase